MLLVVLQCCKYYYFVIDILCTGVRQHKVVKIVLMSSAIK